MWVSDKYKHISVLYHVHSMTCRLLRSSVYGCMTPTLMRRVQTESHLFGHHADAHAGQQRGVGPTPVRLAGHVVPIGRVIPSLSRSEPLRLAVHEHQVPVVDGVEGEVEEPSVHSPRQLPGGLARG